MAMRRAVTAPMAAPMPMPPAIMDHVSRSSTPATHSVVAMAMAMPIMPLRLPARLVTGDDSPRSAMMNRTPETR